MALHSAFPSASGPYHVPQLHKQDLLKASSSAHSIAKQSYQPTKSQPISFQNSVPKKPMRPLTAYHIFFQIEREYIIQTMDGEDADKTIHDKKSLPELRPQSLQIHQAHARLVFRSRQAPKAQAPQITRKDRFPRTVSGHFVSMGQVGADRPRNEEVCPNNCGTRA